MWWASAAPCSSTSASFAAISPTSRAGPLEREHKLRLAFGNGLRPDVWEKVVGRFAVPRVLEFYGSTEGNVSMFNFDGKLGAIGRAPSYLRSRFNIRLARFDVETETPLRGTDGRCLEAAVGEAGECLGEINANDARTAYVGYADKAASERKVLHDAFRTGDAWFRTGDLMRQDAEGYFYFVDRIGDTFRWKGENVSTSEVARRALRGEGRDGDQRLRRPGGRAGWPRRHGLAGGRRADFDIAAFGAAVEGRLPAYAQPVFLRLQSRRSTSPAPSSTASSTSSPTASTRARSRTRSMSVASAATRS